MIDNFLVTHTLDGGRYFTGKSLAVIFSGIILSLIICLLPMLVFIFDTGLTKYDILIFTLFIVIGLILTTIFLQIFIKNVLYEVKILSYLQDAIFIEANLKPTLIKKGLINIYYLEVSFVLDGKIVNYSSLTMGKKPIYDKHFNKFSGEDIPILYSKKYDKVLLGKLK